MIEFKSSCGHTVRARDEDAGKEVKCSYCGHTARVPSARENDLDFFLGDSDLPGASEPAQRAGRRGAGPFARRRRSGDLNPLDVALKLVYAAVAISVVVVVTKKFIIPAFDASDGRFATRPADDADRKSDRPAGGRSSRVGLSGLGGSGGLYISAVPASADIYTIARATPPAPGERIAELPSCSRVTRGGHLSVSDQPYQVEVAIPWNDRLLKRYPGYNTTFRRELERTADPAERDALLAKYFLPDGADAVFVDQTTDQIYLVHQFHNVATRRDAWTSVRAMFLPAGLTMEQLVASYLPNEDQYKFDEENVRGELDFFNVPVSEREYVVRALVRVGVVPYEVADDVTGMKRTLLFKIGVGDGQFKREVLADWHH